MIKNKSIRFLKKLAISLISIVVFISCDGMYSYYTHNPGANLDSYGNIATVASVSFNREPSVKNGIYYIDSSSDFQITYLIDNPGNFNLWAMGNFIGSYNYNTVYNFSVQSPKLITNYFSAERLESLERFSQKIGTSLTILGITSSGKMLPQSQYNGPSIVCAALPQKITNAMGQMYSDAGASVNERLVFALQLPLVSSSLIEWTSLDVVDKRTGAVRSFPFVKDMSTYYYSRIVNGTEIDGWKISTSAPAGLGPTCVGGPTFASNPALGEVCYITTDVDNLTSLEPFFVSLTVKDKYGLTNENEIPSHALKLDPPTCSATSGSVTNAVDCPYYEFTINAPANASDATLHFTIVDGDGNPVSDINGNAGECVGNATFRIYPEKTGGFAKTYTISNVYATKTGWFDSDEVSSTFGSGGSISVEGIQLSTPTVSPASGASLPQESVVTITSPEDANIHWMYSVDGSSPPTQDDVPSPASITLEAAGSYDFTILAYKDYYKNAALINSSYTVVCSSVYVRSDGTDAPGYGTKSYPYGSISYALGRFTDPDLIANTVYILDDMTSINGLTSISGGYCNIVGCKDGTVGSAVSLSLGVTGGGTVFELNGGTLSLRAVTISGANNASSGAVNVIDGTFIVKDKVTITGNTAGGAKKNVNLAAGKVITVDAGGIAGSRIGVTTATAPVAGNSVTFTFGYAAACGTTTPSSYFVSDISGCSVAFNDGGTEADLAVTGGSIDIGDIYSVTFAETHSSDVYTFTATATPTSGSDVDITSEITSWSMKLFYMNADTGASWSTNSADLSSYSAGNYIMKIRVVYGGVTYSGEVSITKSIAFLGSKAPGEPLAVDDIVFNDGSAEPYTSSLNLTSDQANGAIAYIVYVGTGCSDDSSSRIIGAGLAPQNTLMPWCTSSAGAYDQDIESIKLNLYTGKKNGSDILTKISEYLVSNNSLTDDTSNAEHYPAFYYAINYKDQAQSHVSGSAYESGWYLPSGVELEMVRAKKTALSAVMTMCGTELSTGTYWAANLFSGTGSNNRTIVTKIFSASTNDSWEYCTSAAGRVLPVRQF
ncbi:MAG: hypothetical protein K6A42_09385 [Treponema sp.]|nr:hypothetical protein [Treponema sp.]